MGEWVSGDRNVSTERRSNLVSYLRCARSKRIYGMRMNGAKGGMGRKVEERPVKPVRKRTVTNQQQLPHERHTLDQKVMEHPICRRFLYQKNTRKLTTGLITFVKARERE
jgi:hypothetical protein